MAFAWSAADSEPSVRGFRFSSFLRPVEADDLAPGPQPRVDCQHVLLPQRRRQEELADIFDENVDSSLVCPRLQVRTHLRLQRRTEKALVAVTDSDHDLLGSCAAPRDKPPLEERHGSGFVRDNVHGQTAFIGAAEHSENAV